MTRNLDDLTRHIEAEARGDDAATAELEALRHFYSNVAPRRRVRQKPGLWRCACSFRPNRGYLARCPNCGMRRPARESRLDKLARLTRESQNLPGGYK